MQPGEELISIILSCEDKIISYIRQQAEWEIPLHALLYEKLEQRGHITLREEKYPDKKKKSLDILFFYSSVLYAMEIKVESASRPGQIAESSFLTKEKELSSAITGEVADDVQKVVDFKLALSDKELKRKITDPESRTAKKKKMIDDADKNHDGYTKLVMLVGYSRQAQTAMSLIHGDALPTDFGQGTKKFDHDGVERGHANGSLITVGVYYADML
jgi:hypothetical protein